MKVSSLFRTARRWFFKTPDRALDQAYRAALIIKGIEDEYLQGQRVTEASESSTNYSNSVLSYCRTEVENNLKIAKVRLAEFKTTRLFLSLMDLSPNVATSNDPYDDLENREKAGILIEKLNFIDEVLSQYELDFKGTKKQSVSLIPVEEESSQQVIKRPPNNTEVQNLSRSPQDLETVSDKTGVLPRSLFKTFRRIKREIDPQSKEAEAEVLKKFRMSRNKTAISIKFFLVLVIVPLLTHQLAKTFLVGPILENNYHLIPQNPESIFLNEDLEEQAFMELNRFEEMLRFEGLIGLAPEISDEEIESQVKRKAKEIEDKYIHQGSDAISNVFADLFSLIAFAGVIIFSKKDIIIVKSFIDEIIYGLSDSAKSFLIILFTDMFVGFHSPHGWEVFLEGVARHFGLPPSRDFVYLFIATFPVILDTVLKYWIFRYLNRISPSAVATYRTMNE